jgi:cation transport ATPase
VAFATTPVPQALLVSTPGYERTRKDWADRPPSGALGWPTPRWWMAATALAAGLLITLLFLASMGWQSVPCAPLAAVTQAKCVTLAQGFPVHFLSAIPTVGRVAYPAINKGAAAEDMTVWIVLSFAACYLIWLPSHRPSRDAVARIAAPV